MRMKHLRASKNVSSEGIQERVLFPPPELVPEDRPPVAVAVAELDHPSNTRKRSAGRTKLNYLSLPRHAVTTVGSRMPSREVAWR